MIKEILPAEVYEEIKTHLYNRANADFSQQEGYYRPIKESRN